MSLRFCKHYGFVLLPTRPRTPRHKGKVERGVGYVKSNGLQGRVFASLAAQNEGASLTISGNAVPEVELPCPRSLDAILRVRTVNRTDCV